MVNSLVGEPKYLDISKVSKGFAITITKDVIKYLDIEQSINKEIAFCKIAGTNKIILISSAMKGGEIFITAAKLSKQNSLVIPEPIRKMLQLNIGDLVQYWLEPDNRISIKRNEIQY